MRTVSSLLIVLLAAGCASNDKKAVRTQKDKKKYAAAVERGEVLYGMNTSEVKDAVGSPLRKRQEKVFGRQMTRWDYDGYSLFIDEDGYVSRIERAGY